MKRIDTVSGIHEIAAKLEELARTLRGVQYTSTRAAEYELREKDRVANPAVVEGLLRELLDFATVDKNEAVWARERLFDACIEHHTQPCLCAWKRASETP